MIEDPRGLNYLVGAGNTKVEVIGETPLTVRYKESVVNLPRVRVMEKCYFEIMLGLDWIPKSSTIVYIDQGMVKIDIREKKKPLKRLLERIQWQGVLKYQSALSR